MVSKNSFKQRDWLYCFSVIAQKEGLKISIITLSISVVDLSWRKFKMADLLKKLKKIWFNKILIPINSSQENARINLALL